MNFLKIILIFIEGKNPNKKKSTKEEVPPNNEKEAPKEKILSKNIAAHDNSMSIDMSGIQNNNNSLEISNFPSEISRFVQKKNDKKKMEGEETEIKVENELKVSNTKLFEGLACLYQKQQQLEENQKRMEEKLDKILSLLIGKKMQYE